MLDPPIHSKYVKEKKNESHTRYLKPTLGLLRLFGIVIRSDRRQPIQSFNSSRSERLCATSFFVGTSERVTKNLQTVFPSNINNSNQ